MVFSPFYYSIDGQLEILTSRYKYLIINSPQSILFLNQNKSVRTRAENQENDKGKKLYYYLYYGNIMPFNKINMAIDSLPPH